MPRKSKNTSGGFLESLFKNKQPNQQLNKNLIDKQKFQQSIDDIVANTKIIGNSGSSYLEVKLKKDQKIRATNGAMLYMTGKVSMPEAKIDNIGKILAGESLFFQEYTGIGSGIDKDTDNNGTVTFGLDYPNDIIKIEIPFGIEYRLSQNSFLASTENIEISYTTQFKGLFGIGQDEGFLLPVAKCISGTKGYIWLCSYGTFNIKKIAQNDSIIIDNGLFLACDNKIQYEVIKIGKSYISSFLNGEGFGMQFKGPCDIYIQSKNLLGFFNLISLNTSTGSVSGIVSPPISGNNNIINNNDDDTGVNIGDDFEMSGGKKTKKKQNNKSNDNIKRTSSKRKYVKNNKI